MDRIKTYFPKLSDNQLAKLAKLPELYAEWNAQINVISRKDMEHFVERHILHSLAIAKVIKFENGTEILDIGTGGGFPGIPLAIIFPKCEFHLVDATGKKIKVVEAVAEALDLKNVKAEKTRAENINKSYDFIVSRAVTALPKFMPFTKNKIRKRGFNKLENGILYIKGGDFRSELEQIGRKTQTYAISNFYPEEFFDTKYIVHIKG